MLMLPTMLNFWIVLKASLQLGRCHLHYSLKIVKMMAWIGKYHWIQEGCCRPEDAPSGSLVDVNFAFARHLVELSFVRVLVALFKGVPALSSSLVDPTIMASNGVRSLNCCSRSFSLARWLPQNSSFSDNFFRLPDGKVMQNSPFSRYLSNSDYVRQLSWKYPGLNAPPENDRILPRNSYVQHCRRICLDLS